MSQVIAIQQQPIATIEYYLLLKLYRIPFNNASGNLYTFRKGTIFVHIFHAFQQVPCPINSIIIILNTAVFYGMHLALKATIGTSVL